MNQFQQMLDHNKQTVNKFEMIKFLKNREFALLPPSYLRQYHIGSRYFRCHNVQSFSFILWDIMKFMRFKRLFNLYYSLATYKDGLPRFTPNLRERDTSDWKVNHWKEMSGYDWLIDIDAGDHNDIMFAHDSANLIMELFDKCKTPYELRFSGCGFHLIVPYEYIKPLGLHFNPHEKGSVYDFLTSMSKELYNQFSEMVDWNINDSRRICKLPYSAVFYKNKTYIAWSFKSRDNFKYFRLCDMEYGNPKNIKGRGTKVFNEDYKHISFLLDELGIDYNGKEAKDT